MAQIVVGTFAFVSGDTHDATYEAAVKVPRYSEQGSWTLNYVAIADNAGNVDMSPPQFHPGFDVLRTPGDH